MIHYAVLGSGSSGNSYLIPTTSSSLLIDAGFSFKEIRKRISSVDRDVDSIEALMLTHLHPDHARGAGVFARQTKKPVYVNTHLKRTGNKDLVNLGIPDSLLLDFEEDNYFEVGPFRVHPFTTTHDSPHSVGFSIEVHNKTFTIITDTGEISLAFQDAIQKSDVIFLESNYDEKMLDEGPYPYSLKRRIRGKKGHLSNEEAIQLLNESEIAFHQRVYLCHLSKVNNHPDLVKESISRSLRFDAHVTICHNGDTYSDTIS